MATKHICEINFGDVLFLEDTALADDGTKTLVTQDGHVTIIKVGLRNFFTGVLIGVGLSLSTFLVVSSFKSKK
jgi:hypothetical protein